MKNKPRILVAIDTSQGRGRKHALGIAQFAESHAAWDCDFSFLGEYIPEALKRASSMQGVIVSGRFVQDDGLGLTIPVVAVGETTSSVPNVGEDSEAVGRMAAEHLMERGFRHFGYYGFVGTPATLQRSEAFVRHVESRGHVCSRLNLQQRLGGVWHPVDGELSAWLDTLPKPVAVLCAGDPTARQLAMTCRDRGIPVPHQVAILGVSDDELRCRLCRPQLSSVDVGSYMIGFEAARLLQRLLEGHAPPPRALMIPPVRVVIRESTDVLAVEDESVAVASRYIRDHLAEGINVKQLTDHMKTGRRTLEMAFKTHLGRTIHDEIVRIQLQRACQLLTNDTLPLSQVAQGCGMRHRSHLGNFFRKHMGMTPMEYRRKNRQRQVFTE